MRLYEDERRRVLYPEMQAHVERMRYKPHLDPVRRLFDVLDANPWPFPLMVPRDDGG